MIHASLVHEGIQIGSLSALSALKNLISGISVKFFPLLVMEFLIPSHSSA